MKLAKQHKQVFKAGSTTYFNSSLFFPPDIREQVHHLYSFVRIADNYVDQIPQDAEGFKKFRQLYNKAKSGTITNNIIIDDFVALKERKRFPDEWVEAFLDSMEADLYKRKYETLDETLTYIYGSAEVIGLFMSSIMDLPKEARHAAKMLGRAMQYINFIRDIAEDLTFGRIYLPLADTGLEQLTKDYACNNPEQFADFINFHLHKYKIWQTEAEQGYAFIPKRYRIAIKTAGDMYNWTARQIEKNPLLVFNRKCKPSKRRIITSALKNAIRILLT